MTSIAEIFDISCPAELDINRPVLVVEDQQDMRLIIVHHLQKLQFKKVLQSSNGMDALQQLKIHKNCVAVICDWEMPGMNGLHLINEMRENIDVNRIPFCLMMEGVSKEKLMLAVEHGVDDMLVKPLKLGDIIPKARNAFKVFHNKNNPEPVYELAKLALRDNNWDEADRIFRELSKASPNTARPLVGLARVAWGRGDKQAALKLLDEAQENNENYVHIYSYRGKILVEMGETEKGLESLKYAIQLSPLNPMRYEDCVEVLKSQQLFEDIPKVLNRAVQEGVQFNDLYGYLSEAYYNLKDYKKAVRYIRSALDVDRDNTQFLNQLAVSLKEQGELSEAQKTYNKIIKIDPKNLQALYNKALLLEQTENWAEAIKLLDRISKMFPDFEKASVKLNNLRAKHGRQAS